MTKNITNLTQVAEALESVGYEAICHDDAVHTKVGGTQNPFTAVLTINADRNVLVITCQLAKLGDIPEENISTFAVAALDANSRISPFAFATLTASDNPDLDEPQQWPVVLTDSLPLGDLSGGELEAAMDSLWSALAEGRDVLQAGFTGQSN
jgi:hypothetical protein